MIRSFKVLTFNIKLFFRIVVLMLSIGEWSLYGHIWKNMHCPRNTKNDIKILVGQEVFKFVVILPR